MTSHNLYNGEMDRCPACIPLLLMQWCIFVHLPQQAACSNPSFWRIRIGRHVGPHKYMLTNSPTLEVSVCLSFPWYTACLSFFKNSIFSWDFQFLARWGIVIPNSQTEKSLMVRSWQSKCLFAKFATKYFNSWNIFNQTRLVTREALSECYRLLPSR